MLLSPKPWAQPSHSISTSGMLFCFLSAGSAGTTASFELAREYLEGFQAPLDVISGNHDLEALDEFPTDGENLMAFQVRLCAFPGGG